MASSGESEKAFETETVQIEQTQVASRDGFGQKAKRHCLRWWWVHLITFCASFLIIALCLTYVAMPKIAQHGVDESHIEFTDLEFLDPTPDSIVLTQAAILHSPSIFTPTLDPFNASLYLVTNGTFAAEPMTIISMPKIHALHPKGNVTVTGQHVAITSLDQLTQYAIHVLTHENVTTALVGKTKLHEGHLPTTNIHYNSTTTYKALNGLQGFDVLDAKINVSATTGPNFSGFAYIPNPSVMTIAMGNVTLSIATAKEGIIGNSTIENMTLKPGNNTLPMTATIDQTKVLSSLTNGLVDLLITGTSAVYNGEHLTYYEAALGSNVLSLTMNITEVLANSA